VSWIVTCRLYVKDEELVNSSDRDMRYKNMRPSYFVCVSDFIVKATLPLWSWHRVPRLVKHAILSLMLHNVMHYFILMIVLIHHFRTNSHTIWNLRKYFAKISFSIVYDTIFCFKIYNASCLKYHNLITFRKLSWEILPRILNESVKNLCHKSSKLQ